MRARNCLWTLTVSALAFTVAAYAAPRDTAAAGKGKGRLMTGDQASLRTAIDGGVATNGTPYAVLRPVAAGGTQTYPAGTVVDTANAKITVPAGPTKVFFEGRFAGWGAANFKTGQFTIDSATFNTGAGTPMANASPEACVNNAECNTDYGTASSPSYCNANVCEDSFQNTQRADFCLPPPTPTISACSIASPDRTCGTTTLGATAPDTGSECYIGTFVLDLPAGAKGTYTIGMIALGTYIQREGETDPIPLAKMTPAQVIVPVGSCCYAIPSGNCTPDLTQAECNALAAPRLFRPNQACPADGGPACAECATAADCVDERGQCATYTCTANLTCVRTNKPGYVPGGPDCCNPANGNLAGRADTDPCTTDVCSVNDAASLGVPQHSPAADGTACDDDNPCTAADQCTGGDCAGHNVNGDPCTTNDDCTNGGDTPGAVCDGTVCKCTLEPDLTFEKVDPPVNNCYAEGEKITVAIHVGPAANTINGGQFVVVYDNTCLDFNSIVPAGAPYTNEIYKQVNEAAGKIIYAVGIQLGGIGVQGNADMAILSFTKIGDCNECVLCFTNINPEHTYLTDDTGQPIGVNDQCSKPILTKGELTLDTPDSVKVNTGCNSAVATVTWDVPSVSSTCGDVELVCTGTHLESGTVWGPDRVLDGGVFPIGNSNFCCTATDTQCGNTLEGCWTVTVNDETSLDVEIQLSPTMATKPGGGITRCIKFEVFSNCVQAPLVFEEDMVFGGLFDLVGHFNGIVKIPSAVQPECITARDQLHTLRSCYTFADADCDPQGVLHATFKGDPFFGGNWLIGGNLDGWKKDNPAASHDVIDILDFGSIAAEWMHNYDSNGDTVIDGNTPCGVFTSTHADINGDGLVDLLDYSFVSMNFLVDSKDCCCPGSSSLGNTVGRTEISVRELFETGQADLAVADLNADGMVNLADMAALMQGGRPATKPTGRDGKTGGTRSFEKR